MLPATLTFRARRLALPALLVGVLLAVAAGPAGAIETQTVKPRPKSAQLPTTSMPGSRLAGSDKLKPRPRPAAARRIAARMNDRLAAEVRRKGQGKRRTGVFARAAATQWITGSNVWDYGWECWQLGNAGYNTMLSSWSSYGAENPAALRIGDRYYGSALMGVTGLPCAGLQDVATDISAPAGTVVAPDAQNPIRCWVKAAATAQNPNPSFVEMTDQTWSVSGIGSGYWCRSQQVNTGIYGPNLGQVLLGRGWSYELVYPLLSKKPLRGAGAPNGGDRITAALRGSSLARLDPTAPGGYRTGPSTPWVWANVADRAPEFAAPASSAIGNNVAHTRSNVLTYWKSGETWFDIGETPAYGVESARYPLPEDIGFQVDEDWTNLKPGTTYYWRLNFRDAATGMVHRGPNQTFTTTGTPNGTGGTPVAGGGGIPGGSTGGSGSGGGGPTSNGQPADVVAPSVVATAIKTTLKLGTAMSKGLGTNVDCGEPCAAQVEVLLAGATAKKLRISAARPPVVVARTSANLATGKGKLTAKFSAKARKKLKKLKSVKLTLRVTGTDYAGNRSVVSRKVTLKR